MYNQTLFCLKDNYLLVGNRLGHIFLYTTSPRVQLVDCNKTFSKRPILQLAAISECQMVICLSGTSILNNKLFINIIKQLLFYVLEERISVLDVSRDKVIHLKTTGLQKTKGASCFTIDVKVNCFYRLDSSKYNKIN